MGKISPDGLVMFSLVMAPEFLLKSAYGTEINISGPLSLTITTHRFSSLHMHYDLIAQAH